MCDQEVKEKVKDVEYEIVSDKFCVKLSESDINVGQAIEFVTSSASSSPCPFGAVNLFLGITRGVEDGHELSHLYYEAYHVMALNIMRNIVNQVMKTHLNNGSDDGVDSPDGRVFLCHRLGAVSSGQSSILVCVSSRHRQASHLAVMEILNQVKSLVPIWKQVHWKHEEIKDEKQMLKPVWSQKSEAFWVKQN